MRPGQAHDDSEFEWDMTAVAIVVLVIVFLVVAAMAFLPFGHYELTGGIVSTEQQQRS